MPNLTLQDFDLQDLNESDIVLEELLQSDDELELKAEKGLKIEN